MKQIKFLKGVLKNKIKITQAVLLSFLITGNLALSDEINIVPKERVYINKVTDGTKKLYDIKLTFNADKEFAAFEDGMTKKTIILKNFDIENDDILNEIYEATRDNPIEPVPHVQATHEGWTTNVGEEVEGKGVGFGNLEDIILKNLDKDEIILTGKYQMKATIDPYMPYSSTSPRVRARRSLPKEEKSAINVIDRLNPNKTENTVKLGKNMYIKNLKSNEIKNLKVEDVMKSSNNTQINKINAYIYKPYTLKNYDKTSRMAIYEGTVLENGKEVKKEYKTYITENDIPISDASEVPVHPKPIEPKKPTLGVEVRDPNRLSNDEKDKPSLDPITETPPSITISDPSSTPKPRARRSVPAEKPTGDISHVTYEIAADDVIVKSNTFNVTETTFDNRDTGGTRGKIYTIDMDNRRLSDITSPNNTISINGSGKVFGDIGVELDINDNSIDSKHIKDSSITNDKIANGTISENKLDNALKEKINNKLDKGSVYVKTEIDTKLDTKANKTDVYTKQETDNKLNSKANINGSNIIAEKDKKDFRENIGVYSKTEIDNKFNTIDVSELDVTVDDVIKKDGKNAVSGKAVYDYVKNGYATKDDLKSMQNGLDKNLAITGAMTSLKPLAYDPLRPSQFMAGIGMHNLNTAVAVGVAHHVNENLLLNGSMAFTTNLGKKLFEDVVVGAGITWRFGDKEKIDNLPKEQYKEGQANITYELIKENEDLKARIEKLERLLSK